MMVILKLPILYLCGVVYWAIKAEPRPFEGAALAVEAAPEPGADPAACPWRGARARHGTRRPRGGSGRGARRARVRRSAAAHSHR